MEIITYSLRGEKTGSDHYYEIASHFTDEVLAQGEALLEPILDRYQAPDPAAREEHLFELLTLGVLWHVYGDDALDLHGLPRQVLGALGRWREEGGSLKPGIDFLRGVLATLFLEPNDAHACCAPTPAQLDQLLGWLEATGDYGQEVRRLRPWATYFSTLQKPDDALASVVSFAAWFEVRSEEVLGAYTHGVERFLREEQHEHRWREDVVFTARPRVEYHLNMVGAEIMNRAFHTDFMAKGHKVVLLPACMRRLPEEECRALNGALCQGCTPSCRVHQLTRMGQKHGFSVMILSHASSFSREGARATLGEDTGIVGIACVPNLCSGGWKAKALGLPAQCVLLDYCGCKNHWHDEGIPTDINVKQLMRILGIA